MESWLIWLIIGVVFLVVEMLNAGFGIVCLGIGAFLAAIIAALGLGLTWQLLGLVVGTFLSFIFIKPVINKWLDKNNDKKINLDNMIAAIFPSYFPRHIKHPMLYSVAVGI